jgi:hypothetical protein
MSAADDAYARLVAAQRVETPAEQRQRDDEDKRQQQQHRIRKRLWRPF